MRRLLSLPLQLLTLVGLPLLLMLALVAFGGVALHRIAMRDLVAAQDVDTIRGAAASLSEQLNQQAVILTVLSEKTRHGDAPQDVIESLGYLPETIFTGGLAFYRPDGELVAATQEGIDWRSDHRILASLSSAHNSSQTQFIPLIDAGQNNTRIALIVPVPGPVTDADRNLLAVGVTSFQALGVSSLLDSFRADTASVFIASGDGIILLHSDPSMVGDLIIDHGYAQAALRGESGANFYNGPETGEMLAAFAPVPATGWTLVEEQRWAETISPVMRYAQAAPLALLPGLLIAAGALWFGWQRIVQPLQTLENRATDLSWGDFDSIKEPVSGIEEIKHLQQTLQHMADRVQATQDTMHGYIGATTQAEEDERARLARELHDHMIQALIALDHREQRLKRHLEGDEAGLATLAELRDLTAQAIDDLRRIIRNMRPIYLEDLGLSPALKMLAQDTLPGQDGTSIVHFTELGQARRLSPEQEITLYRVAQEALTNARLHSDAQHIDFKLQFDKDAVAMSIHDDGCGFPMPRHATALSGAGHYGLVGMHERATLIGAHLQIKSAPGEGTTVMIKMPLKGNGSG